MTIEKYPSWRYHKTEKARIVESQVEADALGDGWFDNQPDADAYVPPAAAPTPDKAPVKAPAQTKKPATE